MSDTLNALNQQSQQSSLLGILAHPTVVNPLAAVQAGTQVAGQVADTQQKQFNLQQSRLQPAYQAMRMLMATKGDNVTDDDVIRALAQSARLGANVDGLVANATELRANGGKASDFMRATALGGMSPEEQGKYVYSQRMNVNTGSNLVYGTTPGLATPNAGQFNPAGSIQLGLTPAESTDIIQVGVNPDGSPIMKPRGAAYGQPYGVGGAGGAAGGGGGQGTSASQAVNNFGNIRSPSGGFASYATPQDGVAAMAGNLVAYQELHGINTLNGITARWAPAGDGANNPAAYANTISQLTGIDPNAKLDLHDPATLAKIIPAMAQVEHGRPMGVGGDVLSAGINASLGGRPGGGGNAVATGPGGAVGGAGGGGGQVSGPFIGAASAQPVAGGVAVQPAGGGVAVQPAGGAGMQYFSPTGQPIGPGGGAGGQGGPAPYQGYTGLPATFEKTAGASAEMFNTARANYTQQAQRISPLEQSLATLRAHPDLQTGMTAMDFQNINSLAQVLGVQLSPQSIADGSALTEINKNLNRYYRGLPGANRSDMAELDAKLANPSPENQRDALDDLLARTVGAERMNDAGYMHFLESHGSGNASNYAGQYADQTGQYTSKLDPVGFAFDKMTLQQRRAYFDSLSPTEKTRYMNSIKEASRLYNLPIPQGG